MAQLAARAAHTREVGGSSPSPASEVWRMATEAELKQAILDDAAAGIRTSKGDQGEVELFTPEERLKAVKAATTDVAMTKPARGIRFTRISPPGAI